MTAVSQSYPNYLGGLNEQPDEQKKPGQLVEAVNVIPDPTIGLTRRPGFQLIPFVDRDGEGVDLDIDPQGTWFELQLSNQINDDYIYYGVVNRSGFVKIFNQDGERQRVRYTDEDLPVHKNYTFDDNKLTITDENGEFLKQYGEFIPVTNEADSNPPNYLKHRRDNPLKYCVSKDHIIFTNPTRVPKLDDADDTTNDDRKYYSFVNLKQIDTANYNYTFKVYKPGDDEDTNSYQVMTGIKIRDIPNYEDDDMYGRDLSLPLQKQSPFRMTIPPPDGNHYGPKEDAVIEVSFTGQIVQLDSDDGDGYRNEARYSYSVKIVSGGKGFTDENIDGRRDHRISETLTVVGGPDIDIDFVVTDISRVRSVDYDEVIPDDLSNNDNASAVLTELAEGFKEQAGIDKVVIVGSGIYLENNREFSVSTDEIAVADVINSQKKNNDKVPLARVNSVAELPVECYKGFRVEVINSLNDQASYFLEYDAESAPNTDDDDDVVITKADGYWKEIPKPFEQFEPVSNSMPHMITVARQAEETEFVFIVSGIRYAKRRAGTAADNGSLFLDFVPITGINYYKNRLFLFSKNGTVISSRAGKINNFFLNTATTTSLVDPIDVVANSNQRVAIHDSVVVNNAMVLFGESEQYALTTNDSLLTSETVNITKTSNYTYDKDSRPIYLGTNIAFISKGLTRFYEMTNVYDRGPVDINERSQQIQTQFGQGFNIPVSSREQSQVAVYKRYTGAAGKSEDIYIYRFRQENSQESSQTSWVKWSLPKNHYVTYISMPQDKMFVVVYHLIPGQSEGESYLYKMDSGTVEGLPASALSAVPVFLDGWTRDDDGNVDGKEFETRITFPTIYGRSKDVTDVTANLTVHRVKLSTAAVGAYNLDINRYGYDPYSILVEQTPMDAYNANFPQLRGEHVEVVPIYTRNKNLSLTIHTKFNAPLTLQSMTWEGDWNRPYYKSV